MEFKGFFKPKKDEKKWTFHTTKRRTWEPPNKSAKPVKSHMAGGSIYNKYSILELVGPRNI